MTSPADIARELIETPCPHGMFEENGRPVCKARCYTSLIAALQAYGDARAREEREADAVRLEELAGAWGNSSPIPKAKHDSLLAAADAIRARTS